MDSIFLENHLFVMSYKLTDITKLMIFIIYIYIYIFFAINP